MYKLYLFFFLLIGLAKEERCEMDRGALEDSQKLLQVEVSNIKCEFLCDVFFFSIPRHSGSDAMLLGVLVCVCVRKLQKRTGLI